MRERGDKIELNMHINNVLPAVLGVSGEGNRGMLSEASAVGG